MTPQVGGFNVSKMFRLYMPGILASCLLMDCTISVILLGAYFDIIMATNSEKINKLFVIRY